MPSRTMLTRFRWVHFSPSLDCSQPSPLTSNRYIVLFRGWGLEGGVVKLGSDLDVRGVACLFGMPSSIGVGRYHIFKVCAAIHTNSNARVAVVLFRFHSVFHIHWGYLGQVRCGRLCSFYPSRAGCRTSPPLHWAKDYSHTPCSVLLDPIFLSCPCETAPQLSFYRILDNFSYRS